MQAAVAAMDTITVPGTTPKMAPAVMVKGMAGTAGKGGQAGMHSGKRHKGTAGQKPSMDAPGMRSQSCTSTQLSHD